MSTLAHPTARNELSIRLIAVDDHKRELKSAALAARTADISLRAFDTASQWAKAAKKSSKDTILLADNRIDGLDNLSILGCPDIETDHGNNAGLRLLVDYCDRARIASGLKVVLTAFPMSNVALAAIERRNKRMDDNIVVVYKHQEDLVAHLFNLFDEFKECRYMSFLKQKFEFVNAVMNGWEFSEQDKAAALGFSRASDPLLSAMREGRTTSRDAEARYDLIYRLWGNLGLVFGDKEESHRRWLRAPNASLKGKSPIDFIRTGYQDALARVVFQIEGP